MSAHGHHDHALLRERLLEASADRALFGGDPTIDELDAAGEIALDLDAEQASFEAIVAELAIGFARDEPATMPAHVEATLQEICRAVHSAKAKDPRDSATIALPRRTPDRAVAVTRHAPFGWLAAAACIALGAAGTALVLRAGERARTNSGGDATDLNTYLTSHPGTMRLRWSGTDDNHVVGPVAGEVCFDAATDDGILVIEGLAANDPTLEQYQLWIFDAERDERFPVDGGVFDVPKDGRAVIPVQARLPVAKPILFAVTVEKPGGAVVSDRRIALVARP